MSSLRPLPKELRHRQGVRRQGQKNNGMGPPSTDLYSTAFNRNRLASADGAEHTVDGGAAPQGGRGSPRRLKKWSWWCWRWCARCSKGSQTVSLWTYLSLTNGLGTLGDRQSD